MPGMKTTDLSNAKLGDKVWTIQHGWGKITGIRFDKEYRVKINECSYTVDGKFYESNSFPSAFWQEPELPDECYTKPQPEIEPGALCFFSNIKFEFENHCVVARYKAYDLSSKFPHKDQSEGAWKYCRPVTPEDL